MSRLSNLVKKIKNKIEKRDASKTPQDTTQWDNKVYFGIGAPKGDHHSGFHSVNGQGVYSGIAWRGDSRPPEQVFNTGFTVQKDSQFISGRQTSDVAGVSPSDGTTRGIISASEDMWMGAHWAMPAKGKEPAYGWVYLIKVENDPFVASTLANAGDSDTLKKHARAQAEIMFAGVDPGSIVGARKVGVTNGKPYLLDTIVMNPHFKGTLLQVEVIKDDVGLRKFYDPSKSVAANPTEEEFQEIFAKEDARKNRTPKTNQSLQSNTNGMHTKNYDTHSYVVSSPNNPASRVLSVVLSYQNKLMPLKFDPVINAQLLKLDQILKVVNEIHKKMENEQGDRKNQLETLKSIVSDLRVINNDVIQYQKNKQLDLTAKDSVAPTDKKHL